MVPCVGLPCVIVVFPDHTRLLSNQVYAIYRGSISRSKYEPGQEISNNVVCATSKASDQPAHTRSLFRAFASRLDIP